MNEIIFNIETGEKKVMVEPKIEREVLEKALEILAPNGNEKTHEELKNYIEEKISSLGACVFYKYSESADSLMTRLKINFENKELIILPRLLLYSRDYRLRPEKVFEI